MKKILMTTVLTTALFLGATTAQAECPCQHKDKKMPPPPPRFEKMHKKQFTPEQKAKMEQRKAEMEKRLGITEEQKAQLKAIHEQSKEQIAPKIKALTEAEFELKVLKQREYNQNKYGIATLEEVQLSGKTIPQLEAEVKTLKNEILSPSYLSIVGHCGPRCLHVLSCTYYFCI